MSIRAKIVRRSRLGIACIFLAGTASPFSSANAAGPLILPQGAGLIPVQTSHLPDYVGNLFGDQPTTPASGTDPSCDFIECGPDQGTSTGNSTYNPYNPYAGGYGGGYYGQYDPRRMDRSTAVGPEFQCNLFESTPLGEVLSSITALKAVTSAPACDGEINRQTLNDNNAKITQVITDFKPYIDNPDLITADKAGEIGTQVDAAIQSAATIAATFANTALSKKCRAGINGAKLATSISSVINGLTPYALMAASATVGTAAIPFIMGGSILTGVIGNIGSIIEQNTMNVDDELVRRAVLENTCQYVRLEQKYRFLSSTRKEQLKRINQDINLSESMFSAKVKTMSPKANALIVRRNAIELTMRQINESLSSTSDQFKGDKAFFNTAGNERTACNFGVAIAKTTDDKTSYASVMLGTLGQAMAVYGKNSGVQAATLQANAQSAIDDLKSYSTKATHSPDEIKTCAETAKYFVKTIEDSATTSKQLLKYAKSAVEAEMQKTSDFGLLRASIGTLDAKKIQAQRVINSLDALNAFRDTMTRAEIDDSIRNIRESLFSRSWLVMKSPVEKWLRRSEALHNDAIKEFHKGLESLRQQALVIGSGPAVPQVKGKPAVPGVNQKYVDIRAQAQQLQNLTLRTVPLESEVHTNVCRELQGVWNMYGVAVRQLASMYAFCGLIEPYLLDARKDDHFLVVWCRGDRREHGGLSNIATMKKDIITSHVRDWAGLLNRKLNELACVDPTAQPLPPNQAPNQAATQAPK
jgi:hypothetical protein